MLAHQVDHPLEQFQLIFGLAHAASYNHAFPRTGTKRFDDECFHVVAAVKAEQAGLNPNAVLNEPGNSRLDRIRYRLWIPRSGNPVGIEADHQNARRWGRYVHW